jgi:small ligand-binding sensory domain FIST
VRFGASISEHPIPATAVGEVAGDLLEHGGEYADLVCLFVSPHHAGALEDIAAAVHTLLDPKVLIGCAAEAVIGPGREVEDGPAIAAWFGNVGPVEAVRLDVVDNPAGGRAIDGWPIDLPWVPAGAVLLADPFSFPVPALFDVLNKAGGFPRVSGGMASAARGMGGNRLVLNGKVFDSGAVGVLIGANDDTWMETVVSQGARPVGLPFVVTKATGNVIEELAGEPALSRLTTMLRDELDDLDSVLAQQGLLIGLVVDEHLEEFGSGDFLVRTLLDVDQLSGSISIGERIEVGTTVQFHVRDADAADAELRELLAARTTEAALLFSGSGRGEELFGEPDHDAGAVLDAFGNVPVAGFFAAGEFGPVGGRNHVHGFSASLSLFEAPTADG